MKKQNTAVLDGELGTDTLKDLIKFLIKVVQKATALDEDGNGRISLLEAISAAASLGFKFPAVYNSFPRVKAEWKDLTPAELSELAAWFASEFDLPAIEHGRIELLIKKSITIIVDNYNHIQDIKTILG